MNISLAERYFLPANYEIDDNVQGVRTAAASRHPRLETEPTRNTAASEIESDFISLL